MRKIMQPIPDQLRRALVQVPRKFGATSFNTGEHHGPLDLPVENIIEGDTLYQQEHDVYENNG